jgi:hypothetical protein
VPLYMDVHVPQQITDQLRRRGAEVLTAIEDGWAEATDEDLLEHARQLGRVMFTQDIRFRAVAEEWQRQGRPFAGLIFGHQLGGTIGQYVNDLDLLSQATDLGEWQNMVEWLPLYRSQSDLYVRLREPVERVDVGWRRLADGRGLTLGRLA